MGIKLAVLTQTERMAAGITQVERSLYGSVEEAVHLATGI